MLCPACMQRQDFLAIVDRLSVPLGPSVGLKYIIPSPRTTSYQMGADNGEHQEEVFRSASKKLVAIPTPNE
jgi:hypothetical protein